MLLEKLFQLKETGTTVRRELIAGSHEFYDNLVYNLCSTFAAFVIWYGLWAVMVATCVSSAIASFFMAFLTNYPVVLAPGMGLNAYFVFDVCQGPKLTVARSIGHRFHSWHVVFHPSHSSESVKPS